MTNDIVGVVLVLLKEVGNAREGNLIDIFVNLLLGHADTVVANGDSTFLGIQIHTYGEIVQFVSIFTFLLECLQFLCGVDCIRNHLTQENLLVAIEKLFDDGENILSCNPDVTFLHILFCFELSDMPKAKSVPIKTEARILGIISVLFPFADG